jgi:hypothetical protein
MDMLTYTRGVSTQAGNSPALKLEPGQAYALLIDPVRAPKAAKFEQHAVGVELYRQDDDGKVAWQPATIYLRARELAELASVCAADVRSIVQAWVELTPVVNAMTGEVRLRDDGSEVCRRSLRFAADCHEGAETWGDWSTPERTSQPRPERVTYARPAAGPPVFVRPGK